MSFDILQNAQRQIIEILAGRFQSPKLFSVLLLEGDQECLESVRALDPEAASEISRVIEKVNAAISRPAEFSLAMRHRDQAEKIVSLAVRQDPMGKPWRHRLDDFLMNPFSGWITVFLVLYFIFYQFVGVFGAGTVVSFLENEVFSKWINPLVTQFFESWISHEAVLDLLVGEYGVFTLGVRYAVSLILPIVAFFFMAFSIVEDTGYLPRLALLLDRFFKKIGLSGRAVIPMVLGFGCVTMATLVTRTLPTKRERVIATLLLALAVPCSAQLGVILGLLAVYPKALILWGLTLIFVFLLVGSAVSKILPGQAASFYMELPPLRMPLASNVLMKTWTRLRWYFVEILPLFLLISVLIWAGKLTGVFDWLVAKIAFFLKLVGLPSEAGPAFLFGFFRRDYGAAGLYDLAQDGTLDAKQLFVACVALTLFLPCVAQFLVNMKERGWKVGLGISVFTLFFAFGAAFAAYHVVTFFKVFG